MRLINCKTFRLEEFIGGDTPPYAILSHTWGKEEISFSEFNEGGVSLRDDSTMKEGHKKIAFICEQALGNKIRYAWVDTCCIDKSSSAELSEAINSMFEWYRRSKICYVYLSDVLRKDVLTDFPKSRWFRRGWTLQELIAPRELEFFDREGNLLYSKRGHASLISHISGIDEDVLSGDVERALRAKCVARRMSWASQRETTRVEDTAYALLGIFNVNMPLIYGEGQKAFRRLQEEIMKVSHDESILAWGLDTKVDNSGLTTALRATLESFGASYSPLLASSPTDFENCGNLRIGPFVSSSFMMTNFGLQIEMALVAPAGLPGVDYGPTLDDCYVGLLNCDTGTSSEKAGILLNFQNQFGGIRVFRRMMFGSEAIEKTALVGIRHASHAVMGKIIILEEARTSLVLERRLSGEHQFLINMSPTINQRGYVVQSTRAWVYNYVVKRVILKKTAILWNPEAHVLTAFTRGRTSQSSSVGNLIAIAFNSTKGCPEFLVLIEDHKLIIQQGLDFSIADYEFGHGTEGTFTEKDKEQDLLMMIGPGLMRFHVKVSLTWKKLHQWDICTLDIDADDI